MDPEPSQAVTLNQCIDQVAQRLETADLHYGHGAIDAQSEALWIASKQLEISPADALDQLDQTITSDQYQNALLLVNHIFLKFPLIYLPH